MCGECEMLNDAWKYNIEWRTYQRYIEPLNPGGWVAGGLVAQISQVRTK